VLEHIPDGGENLLDMASGPIQYPEYLEFSKSFRKRYCVDLSEKALNGAREKIGTHGEYFHGNFLDMDFENNFFDCAISLHTIYHIDKDLQETAVRKLLAVTRVGAPVIIVYSNPDTLIKRLGWPKRGLKRIFGSNRKSADSSDQELYFFTHPLSWWDRFDQVAEKQFFPWRSLASHHQKKLIPNNRLGRKVLVFLYYLENLFPKFFVKHFQYPMIILKKTRPFGPK
jgi:ubiquinone/menaquinone biosynthesis C-methylase UbiE